MAAAILPHLSDCTTPSAHDILVLYDGLSAAQQAADLVATLILENDGERPKTSSWHFSMLSQPGPRHRSLALARRARWLIVASHRQRPLPTEFTHWLEESLQRPGGEEGTVIALTDTPAPTLATLQEVVDRCGGRLILREPLEAVADCSLGVAAILAPLRSA